MPENYGRSVETLPRIDTAAAAQRVDFDVSLCRGIHRADARTAASRRSVQITWSVPHPELAGRMLDDIAREWRVTAREAAERLLPAGAIFFRWTTGCAAHSAHRLAMIGSDGLPHDVPASAPVGTFPRVLGHYARIWACSAWRRRCTR
jgi:N-acyl-D-amino-acid deacylase